MQNNITYLTFNDPPNGVYNSQVIEVVELMKGLVSGVKVRLIAFISPRGFKENKAKIKALNAQAIVLPAIAPLKYWYLNKVLLRLVSIFIRTEKVICRGPLATCMALDVFNKRASVVYDGRGAVLAEHEEFGVFKNTGLENQLFVIEQKAVLESDYRIAVTAKLIRYWQARFSYNSNKHVIIPCTVSESQSKSEVPQTITSFIQAHQKKVLFAFAGGNGKWQGIDLMLKFLSDQFEQNPNAAALLLCPTNDALEIFQEKYNDRVLITTVHPAQVNSVISLCDYGLLLRHQTITNQVASPVKVAEYLNAGLKVVISPAIGDYTEVIEKENCGIVYSGGDMQITKKLNCGDRLHCQEVTQRLFSKNSNIIGEAYRKVLIS